MEMLNVLRRLCDNGHLVIITTQALPEKTAELFNQLVLLSDKQVSKKGKLWRLGLTIARKYVLLYQKIYFFIISGLRSYYDYFIFRVSSEFFYLRVKLLSLSKLTSDLIL